jgi:hypothetical protein
VNPEILHIVDSIKDRIEKTRRILYREELYRALINAFSIGLLLLTIVMLAESIAEFDATVRTILFYGYCITASAVLMWFTGKPLLCFFKILPQASNEEIARLIGSKFDQVGDRLENALDLSEMVRRGEASYSPELVEVSLEHFQRSTAGMDFTLSVSYERVKFLLKTLSAVTAIVAIVLVIPGSPFGEAAARLWNHDLQYTEPAPFTIIVDPGSINIVKGEPVHIKAHLQMTTPAADASLPDHMTMSFTQEGVSTPQEISLLKDSLGYFRYLFPSVKNSLHYFLEAVSVKSEEYSISVSDRPFIRSMKVSLIPPSYTKLARQSLEENIGDIVALAGTRVQWTIRASKDLKKCSMIMKEGKEIPLTKEGEEYTASYNVRYPTTYFVKLEDVNGISSTGDIEYKITVIPDEYPTVEIVTPGRNVDVTKAMQMPLEFKIGDDFGITQLTLSFRLIQSKYENAEKSYGIIIPLDTIKQSNGIIPYDWDISVMGLVPEDVVEYFAQVFDNDNVSGPKSAKSQTYLIRLPSLEEVFADADNLHDDAQKTLENSLKQAEDLKKDLEDLSNDMKRNQQMDWQKQNKTEDIAKKYQDIQKKIEDVNKQMDAMTQTLQRNNTLSPETLEKYTELQKMMQEMNSPEFQNALKRMQEAMKNVSPDQLLDAMQQVQFSEEQFRSSIERTLNLLKRIQVEEKVDEMVKRAAEMQREQEEVMKNTQQIKDNDAQKAGELSRKQDEINQQLSQMQEAMKDLREKMEEFSKEMPLDKLSDAEKSVNDQDMKDAMKQSSQNLSSMQMESAMAAQQNAQSGMKEMSDQLSELQQQMLNNQMQQTMNTLNKGMQDMLQLSQRQEQLKNQSRTLDPNSQQFREMAQEQQSIQGDLSNVANMMADLSQKSFVVTPEMGKSIGRAMGQMQQAMSGIDQRNGLQTSSNQGEAMASLNKSATLMQQAMQSLQQSGGQGGGSLLQQLRNMAMQQQGINMQSQQLGGQQGLSQEQMREMGRLAKQQEAVRKSLDQLQKEAQGSSEKERIHGDLQKISDEMKEVVEQLKQNDVSPETIQRQERILSRLLQAQSSTRERDYEERRQATTGTTIIRKSPAELSLQTKETQLQRDLQKAIDAGYSKDYIDLIRKYYEALGKNN